MVCRKVSSARTFTSLYCLTPYAFKRTTTYRLKPHYGIFLVPFMKRQTSFSLIHWEMCSVTSPAEPLSFPFGWKSSWLPSSAPPARLSLLNQHLLLPARNSYGCCSDLGVKTVEVRNRRADLCEAAAARCKNNFEPVENINLILL